MIYIVEENINKIIDCCYKLTNIRHILFANKEDMFKMIYKYNIIIETDHFLTNKEYKEPNFEKETTGINVISIRGRCGKLFGEVGIAYKGYDWDDVYYKME